MQAKTLFNPDKSERNLEDLFGKDQDQKLRIMLAEQIMSEAAYPSTVVVDNQWGAGYDRGTQSVLGSKNEKNHAVSLDDNSLARRSCQAAFRQAAHALSRWFCNYYRQFANC